MKARDKGPEGGGEGGRRESKGWGQHDSKKWVPGGQGKCGGGG